MLVILDTNVLLAIYEAKIDIMAELNRIVSQKVEIGVVQQTISELEECLQSPKLHKRKAAQLALAFLKKTPHKTLKLPGKTADEAIIAYAQIHKETTVATQDKALKAALKKAGTAIIVIRNRRYLTLDHGMFINS